MADTFNRNIIKSISKSYGVPGLRLGILVCGDSKIIDNIKKDATDTLSGLYSALKDAERDIKAKINELLNSKQQYFIDKRINNIYYQKKIQSLHASNKEI